MYMYYRPAVYWCVSFYANLHYSSTLYMAMEMYIKKLYEVTELNVCICRDGASRGNICQSR